MQAMSNEMQFNLFEGISPLKITKPIRLIELFAGIGAQAKALENLGVPFEHYRSCEIDKYAVKSYNAVHCTNFETSDITKLHGADLGITDTDKYTYIMTYSFPCQDLSNAGKQKGMTKGSGTRSGLLWEVERLITELDELPQILLMENVPQVHGAKNLEDFKKWIEFLQSYGYCSKWKDLNAKDYGIPQNRNRCFMVSWLGDYYYQFPPAIPLELRLKDMLEDHVDEKYYLKDDVVEKMLWLSQKAVDYILAPKRGAFNYINPEICSALTAKGQNNWIGTFISPDIVSVEHDVKLGGVQPTVIYLVNGKTLLFDGKTYVERTD